MQDQNLSGESSDIFHIVACHGSGTAFRKYLSRSSALEGVYHVCGTHPWFLVYRYSPDSLSLAHALTGPQAPLNLRYGFSALASLVEREASDPEDAQDGIHNHIFVRPLGDHQEQGDFRKKFLDTIRGHVSAVDGRVQRVLALHQSEWLFCIETWFPQFGKLGEFVTNCRDNHVEVSTRCVLVRWIHRRESRTYDVLHSRRRRSFQREPAPHPELKCATTVRNDYRFFERPLDERLAILECSLNREIEPTLEDATEIEDQLTFEPMGRYVELNRLVHPNRYVRRVSIRPVSQCWTRHFILLRLKREDSPEKIAEQQARVVGLVGISANLVIPFIYRVAGQHGQLLISAYTLGELGRRDLEGQVSALDPFEIPSPITCTLPEERTTELNVLTRSDIAVLGALYRNGAHVDEFWNEMREIQRGEANELQFSPRALPVLAHCASQSRHPDGSARTSQKRRTGLVESMSQLTEKLGFGLTWELCADRMRFAFVRLYPRVNADIRPVAQQNHDALRGILAANSIAFDYFMTERNEIVGVARFEHLAQLERFLWQLRRSFRRTEFHLMMDQAASISGLPEAEICAPCAYPTDAKLRRPSVDCSRCGRYVRKSPAQGLKLRVDLRPEEHRSSIERFRDENKMKEVTFGALDLHLSVPDLIDIGAIPAWLEPKGRRMQADDYSAEAKWRSAAESDAYVEGLIVALTRGPLAEADVVVLPEYCVPLHAVRHLLEHLDKNRGARERILVLGSHLDERGYNTAPIVHVRPDDLKVYWQQKLRRSPIEKDYGHVLNVGNASYVLRTSFGNMLVAICADIYAIEDRLRTVDLDAVLIPSYHDGPKGSSFEDAFARNIDTIGLVRVFANGAHQEHKRTPSQVYDSSTAKSECAELRVEVGTHAAGIVTRTANVLENDYARIRARRGRPPEAVIPIHPDLWTEDRQREIAGQAVDLLRPLSHDDGGRRRAGKLEDHLMLDWEAAGAHWGDARE